MRLVRFLAPIVFAIGAACVGSEAGNVSPPPSTPAEGGISDAGTVDTGPCSNDLQTDPKNCGVCAHDCLGGACAGGKCQALEITNGRLVPNECPPANASACIAGTYAGLASDGVDLYIADVGTLNNDPSGGIVRLNKDVTTATAPHVIVTTGGVDSLTVGTTDIYWQSRGALRRIAKAGGTSESVVRTNDGPQDVTQFLTANNELISATANSVVVQKLDADAGVETISDPADTQRVRGLAVEGDLVCWWTDNRRILVRDRSNMSAGPKAVASDQDPGDRGVMALRDRTLYWVVKDGAVQSANPLQPFAARLGKTDVYPHAIAVDERDVYVGTWGECRSRPCGIDGKVFRVPRQTGRGEVELLDHGIQLPTGLVVDGKAIYWTTWWVHSVKRLAK